MYHASPLQPEVNAHTGIGETCPNVQFGCGWCAPEGWWNFDASPTLRFERVPIVGRLWTKNVTRFPKNVMYGDIVRGLPVASKSCENVYSSHVLEHLCLDDFGTALHNTYRLLRPGGIFRFVLPDLSFCIDQYAAANSRDAALIFMKQTALGRESRARGLRGILVAWLGNSSHLWMWDFESIEDELKRVGFCEVRRAFFNDSLEPSFRKVEAKERWDNCLGVECQRPVSDAMPDDECSRKLRLNLDEGRSANAAKRTSAFGRAMAFSNGAVRGSTSRNSDTL